MLVHKFERLFGRTQSGISNRLLVFSRQQQQQQKLSSSMYMSSMKKRAFASSSKTTTPIRAAAAASSAGPTVPSKQGVTKPPSSSASASAAAEQLSYYEDWMVNLRGEHWLNGPRSDSWFTGKHPEECPGLMADGTFTSLPMPRLDRVTRTATQEYFDNTWTFYEMLFAGLNSEEYFYRPPPHGLRHPQIFYYGHTPCLYVNKLLVSGVLKEGVNPYFESIYETGVDEMLWDDMHKNDMVWPTVAETHEYRKEVYQVVTDVIQSQLSDSTPETVTWDHPMWALFMGFEHDRIHFETSSVLFREAPLDLVQKPRGWPKQAPLTSEATHYPERGQEYPESNPMLPVKGDDVQLGKPRKFPSYGWDNEYGTRTVTTPDFHASKYMITNGEFLEFVKAGGYRTEEYWSEDGWGWKKFRNAKEPFFWKWDGPQGSFRFKLRTIFEEVPMPWDAPVCVNHHEAKAYCAWKSKQDSTSYRLPTETEWNLMKNKSISLKEARSNPEADPILTKSGFDFANEKIGNLNMGFGAETPVTMFPPSDSGHCDVMGNVWEHCEDHFNPLEGGLVSYVGGEHMCNYEIHPVYDDFSLPCYDGRHDMILGGSFISTGDEASTFARFHFRRHFLQHSGFRLVTSNDEIPATFLNEEYQFGEMAAASSAVDGDSDTMATTATPGNTGNAGDEIDDNVYETQELVDMYLGMHFSTNSGQTENIPYMMEHEHLPAHTLRFPQRVAELVIDLDTTSEKKRALDLGCAVGGTSFSLAKEYDEVIGIDFSQAFIDAANEMKHDDAKPVHFNIPMEGNLSANVMACHEDGVTVDHKNKITFLQGDACNLNEEELGQFDVVALANLICRLPEPLKCLDSLERMVKPNGLVVMTTPFSWLDEFTNESKWLGGFTDPVDGKAVHGEDTLLRAMEARGFERIYKEPFPLTIREHARKYQYIVADGSAWRKL